MDKLIDVIRDIARCALGLGEFEQEQMLSYIDNILDQHNIDSFQLLEHGVIVPIREDVACPTCNRYYEGS